MEYEKPPQPPPAIVITAPELAGQFGVPIDRAEMVAEARSHAIERIDSFVASLNRAASESSTGYFVADKSLLFRADGDARLATAVTEALRLPDERLLTKASLDALIEANQRSNPDMAAKLAELRDGGSPTIAKGQSFAVRSAEGLRYEMLQNDALADMLRALPERHLNARGRENRDKILVITGHIDAHKEAQALGLEIERGNGSLALRAETGALERIEALSPLLETLKEVADRAKKLSMPEAQLSSIQRIYETARSQSAATAIDASQRASDIAELRGDGELAMRHLSAAEELVRRFAAPERREEELAQNREQARHLIARTVSAKLVDGTSFDDFRKIVERFFDGAEAEVVVARSLLNAAQTSRNRQLMNGVDSPNDSFGKECYKRAAESYASALKRLGFGGAGPVELTKEERPLAYEASSYMIERALSEGDMSSLERLVAFRRGGIHGAPAEEAERQGFALQIRLARAVFEAPDKYSPEIADYLGVRAGSSRQETRAHLLELVEARTEALALRLKDLPQDNENATSRRDLAEDLTEAQVALSRMLVHGVVSLREGDAVKMAYYRKLDALNSSILESEREIIDRMKDQAAELGRRKELADGAGARLIDDRVQVLEAGIKAREISAAMILVQQAEVALHGNAPELTREAKRLIEEAERFGNGHPGIERLARTFRESNNPGSLQAAAEEFLAEVNKDYPPYVLGMMIAAGVLGAAAGYSAWKSRGALYGFMASSCATLAATKLYFGLQGIDQIQAAYQTGLSPHSPTQNLLNVLYLGADVAQAWPLIPAALGVWALSRLRERSQVTEETLQPEKARTVVGHAVDALSKAGKEGVELGKAVVSLADPRTFTFWLLATTIGAATYQVMGSDLPSSVQQDQMTRLGLELMQTLSIALLYDRIAANLSDRTKNPRDAMNEAVETLNEAAPPEEPKRT